MADDVIIPGPSPEEYNRGPRRFTDTSPMRQRFGPGFERIEAVADFLNVPKDIVQNLGGAAREAFNPDLPTDERLRKGTEAGIGTLAYGLAGPVLGKYLGQKASQIIPEMFLGFSGPETKPLDELSDKSRRDFIKGMGATGIAAIAAPEVITEAFKKVPAAVKRVRGGGPIATVLKGISANEEKVRILRDKTYKLADQINPFLEGQRKTTLPIKTSPEEIEQSAKAMKETRELQKEYGSLEARNDNRILDLLGEIRDNPEILDEARDEDLEEFIMYLDQLPMVGYGERLEDAEFADIYQEIKKRGLDTSKTKDGINNYPFANQLAEDYEFGILGDGPNTPAPFDPSMKMTDRDSSFDSDAYLKQQGFMQRSPFETFRLKKLEYEGNGLAGNELDGLLDNLARNLNIERPDKVEVFHATRGAPFTKFDAAAAQQSANYYNMGAAGPGAYFSTNLNYPSQHVGGRGSLMSAEIDTSEMLNVKLNKPLTKPQIEGLSSALSSMPDFDGNPIVVKQKDDILTVSYKRRPTSIYDEGGEATIQIDTKNPDDVFRKVDRITEGIKNPQRKDEKGLVFSNQEMGDKQILRKVFEDSGFTGVVGGTTEVSGGPNNIVIYDTSLIPEMTIRIDQGEIPTDDADLMPLLKRTEGGEIKKSIDFITYKLLHNDVKQGEPLSDDNQKTYLRLKEKYGPLPIKRMNGGEMRKGVGSLNDIARNMTRGPKGIGAYEQFSSGGDVSGPPPLRGPDPQGILSLSNGGSAEIDTSEYRRLLREKESSNRLDAVFPSKDPDRRAMGLYQAMPKTLNAFRSETGREFTNEQFLQSRDLQEAFQDWYEGSTFDYIEKFNLDKYYGEIIGGVPITPAALLAMAHIGGNYGMRQFLESGGEKDEEDANQTSLSDRGKMFSGIPIGSPVEQQMQYETAAYAPVREQGPLRPRARPFAVEPTPGQFSGDLVESLRPRARPMPQAPAPITPAQRTNLEQAYSPPNIESMLIGANPAGPLQVPAPQGLLLPAERLALSRQ